MKREAPLGRWQVTTNYRCAFAALKFQYLHSLEGELDIEPHLRKH